MGPVALEMPNSHVPCSFHGTHSRTTVFLIHGGKAGALRPSDRKWLLSIPDRGFTLIEGEDALRGAFCPRCHLCLRGPLVSVSEPKHIAGQDREGGTTNRASTRTENSSSLGPTLSVCSDEPLTYTFKCLALLSLALKCQCSTWSQTWNTSLSLTIGGRITLHSRAPGLWSGVPDPASRCPFSLT